MHLKLENPKIFADIVGIISELVNEVRLKVTAEGLSVTAIDPANVAMVYFRIPNELFSEFNIDKESVLGVSLESLKAVLRRCKPGASLVMEREDNILKLSINDRTKRDFSLALIDIEGDDKEMPKWEFKSVIKMNSDSFAEAVEDCQIVSDACTFRAEPTRFVMEASGLNSARIEFGSEEAEIYSDTSVARFSLEYLSKFVKGGKISARTNISFSENHPMRIDFPTGNIMLSFVLAPRVEQD